jgi:hypothetical protein
MLQCRGWDVGAWHFVREWKRFYGTQSEEEAILEARHIRGSFHCSIIAASLILVRHREFLASLKIQGDQWDAAFACLCIHVCALHISLGLQLGMSGKAP